MERLLRVVDGDQKISSLAREVERDFEVWRRTEWAVAFEFYEERREQWITEHPDATAAYYTAAMTLIARECGV